MTVEHAVHRLTAEVAEWFGLPTRARCARETAPTSSVIDPAGLDESVDAYHEEKVPFYGDLSRMVNRNDAAIVATGVNGAVVFREGRVPRRLRGDREVRTVPEGRRSRHGNRVSA